MKTLAKENHATASLQQKWLAEMRAILAPSSVVDESVQQRIAKHVQHCFLVENLQTNSMFFLLDSIRMEYLFVSSSTEAVLGYTSEEVIANGFQWLFSLLSPAELAYKKQAVDDFFGFLKTLNRADVMNATVRYDIVGSRKNGKKVHLLEEVMFPEVNENGEPLLISCFLHDIAEYVDSEKRQSHIYLLQPDGLKTIFSKKYSVDDKEPVPLSRRELQVLEQFSNGMSTAEVANKLFITDNTIKSHRKNILLKLGVQNTAEAVKLALKKKWIS